MRDKLGTGGGETTLKVHLLLLLPPSNFQTEKSGFWTGLKLSLSEKKWI